MAKKATRSRGKFVVLIRTADGSTIDGTSLRERTLDGGVGGVKDRYAAARLLAWWLTDNGHADRKTAAAIAYRAEVGGAQAELVVDGRTLQFTITEQ